MTFPSPINPNPAPAAAPKPTMTLEDAWLRAHAVLSDMEQVTGRTPAYTVRRWATRLGEALAVIDDAGAELSAGVCPHVGGGEGGGAICLRDGRAI